MKVGVLGLRRTWIRCSPPPVMKGKQAAPISSQYHTRGHRDARFELLTKYEGDEVIHQALEAGARSYIIKGMPLEALVNAIRRIHAGGRFLPPPVTRTLSNRLPESSLSAREREVLSLIVRGKSNKEITTEIGIAELTVKCHVSVILMRLDANDRMQAVVTALQRGLIHL